MVPNKVTGSASTCGLKMGDLKGVGNQSYHLDKMEDQSLSTFKWNNWDLTFSAFILIIAGIISIGGQALIIHYIKDHTKKERPIDRLILVDQVYVHISII